MMLKLQNKSQRAKGLKVKHILQACLLLALCIWLLYQVKRSYHQRKGDTEGSEETPKGMMFRESQLMKLGRKNIDPQESRFRVEESARTQEVETGKNEETDDEGREGGDAETDERDLERREDDESEQAEDLIDEDDREKEDEEGETVNEMESLRSSGDRVGDEGERSYREAREEHYNADDASASVERRSRAD